MGICQEKAETPMEIALDRHNKEVFKMLEEVAEIPDKIKLIQLKKIIQSEKTSKREKDKFQTILGSLPVDLVIFFWKKMIIFLSYDIVCINLLNIRQVLQRYERRRFCSMPYLLKE